MFRGHNNGFWEDERERWKRIKRGRKKGIFCGPRIIKGGMALSLASETEVREVMPEETQTLGKLAKTEQK